MKKNLFVKFIALGLIGFGAWSLSGCEKDIVADAVSENSSSATPIVRGKQLNVSTPDGTTVVLEVSSSDKSLLDQVAAKDFSALLNEAAIPTDESHVHEKQLAPSPELPLHYVTVQMLGAYSESPIERYTVQFSKAFQDLLRREKAGLHIILTPSQTEPTNRAAGWWARTPYCGTVMCYGDGGQIQTGVTTYRPTSVGQSPVHTFYFYNSASCNKCSHGVNYLDDIWVFQDVLSSYWSATSC